MRDSAGLAPDFAAYCGARLSPRAAAQCSAPVRRLAE